MKKREDFERTPLRTVVVVAVGAVTSQGDTAKALWDGVSTGHVAIRPVEHLPMDEYRTRIGGEVRSPVPPSPIAATVGGFRYRAFDFAFAAAAEAMDASSALIAEVEPERRGLVLGTCNAGLLSTLEWLGDVSGDGTAELAMYGPPQAIAESLAAHFRCAGPVLSVNTACAAGANAIGYAADLIAFGRADIVLAGGTDALSDVAYAGFNSLGSLSPTPAAPYQDKRTGLSLGEGSGMLVLARADLAAAADVEPLCEIRGYGLSADGYHPTAPRPDGTGAARAIRSAIEWAGLRDSDIGYINSHGTGTPRNDSAEAAATRLALGEAADTVPVSSSKSMIGHLLGATGAVEAIITVGALRNGVLPPTANLVKPDPECVLDHIPVTPRISKAHTAISNNFAFAGANASVVFADRAADAVRPAAPVTRVVITGAGAVGPAGVGVEAALRAVAEGRDCARLEEGIRLGLIGADPHDHLTRREARRMDRLGLLSTFAASQALEAAGEDLISDDPNQVGVVFGTGLGPMQAMEQFVRPLREEGAAAANPAVFPNTVYNAAAGSVATLLGALGPTSTVTAGHAAGANALRYGYDLVSVGRAGHPGHRRRHHHPAGGPRLPAAGSADGSRGFVRARRGRGDRRCGELRQCAPPRRDRVRRSARACRGLRCARRGPHRSARRGHGAGHAGGHRERRSGGLRYRPGLDERNRAARRRRPRTHRPAQAFRRRRTTAHCREAGPRRADRRRRTAQCGAGRIPSRPDQRRRGAGEQLLAGRHPFQHRAGPGRELT